MTKPRLLMLKLNQLKTHPQNIRRFYPEQEVCEMAESIRANRGVLVPMMIVPADKPKIWYVVAGNKRLAGGRLLGKDCPLLKCEPVDMNKAQQLLAMATENFVRSDPDPVSEALYYQRLQAEGLSVRDIIKGTGMYEARIYGRLKIAELDEPIQRHMAEGKLPAGPVTCDALLSIPDRKLRIQLANRLAANPNITVATITKSCARLLESLKAKAAPPMKTPSLEMARIGRPKGSVAVKDLRSAANHTCKACDLHETILRDAKEPAWSVIAHVAEDVCGSCNLITVQEVCKACPAVELLRALVPNDKEKK